MFFQLNLTTNQQRSLFFKVYDYKMSFLQCVSLFLHGIIWSVRTRTGIQRHLKLGHGKCNCFQWDSIKFMKKIANVLIMLTYYFVTN